MRRYDTSDLGEFVLLRKLGEFAPTRIRMAIPADTDLHGMLDVMATFLRACGYHVPLDAALDLVHATTGLPYDECGPLDGTLETDGTSAEVIDP